MARPYEYTSGWVTLAGQFPPTLNKEDDPSKLKPFESPDCYGVDAESEGFLKSGSIPSGTARNAPTLTLTGGPEAWATGLAYKVGAVVTQSSTVYICVTDHTAGTFATDLAAVKWKTSTWYQYYRRPWGFANAICVYGAPEYDTKLYLQGFGRLQAKANIVNVLPCLRDRIWVVTNTGSQLIDGADSPAGNFRFNNFAQEMTASTATHAMTLNELPIVSNAQGVFSWDGNQVKEWTRPIRGTLGNFGTGVAITSDYKKRFIIGTSKFAIDAENGKLFDFGTSGFRFTTRTLANPDYTPIQAGTVRFVYARTSTARATIKWETKSEDDSWYKEKNIVLMSSDGTKTAVEYAINNPKPAAHKFAVRITSLSSNIKIREIQVDVANYAAERVAN